MWQKALPRFRHQWQWRRPRSQWLCTGSCHCCNRTGSGLLFGKREQPGSASASVNRRGCLNPSRCQCRWLARGVEGQGLLLGPWHWHNWQALRANVAGNASATATIPTGDNNLSANGLDAAGKGSKGNTKHGARYLINCATKGRLNMSDGTATLTI